MTDARWHIAITGIGLVTPLGIGCSESVSNLLAGNSGIIGLSENEGGITAGRVPPFDLAPLLEQPKNIKLMGHPVRLALLASKEAVEQSGLAGAAIDPERIGVYAGSGQTGLEYDEFFKALSLAWEGGRQQDFKYLGGMPSRVIDRYFSLRTLANAGIAMLSTEFNARGPSNNFVQGEIAPAVALRTACFDLMEGRCDAAIVAGYDSLLIPSLVVAYRKLGLLSGDGRDSHYRPFDRRRDGIAVAEAASCLIIERTESAVTRRARVLGKIQGVGLSSATADRPGLTAGPEDIASAAGLATGNHAFDFVVARGLGTQSDDLLEADSLARFLPPGIPVTALKSYTGYSGASTSLTEVALGLLTARLGMVPHVLGLEQADERISLNLVLTKPAKIEKLDPEGLFFSSTFGGQVVAVAAQALTNYGLLPQTLKFLVNLPILSS